MAGEADNALERGLMAAGIGAAAARAAAVPTVDLAAGDEAAAAAMWEAATSVGFFQVVNHGIAQQEVDAAFTASANFFARPLEEKEAEAPFAREANSGYEHMKQVRPSTGTPDRKESLQITARAGAMDGRWPQQPEGFEESARHFLELAHGLGCRILDLLQPRACPHLEPGTLRRSHTLWGADGQSTLRMLHYMPLEGASLAALREEGDGSRHWRAGPHTDWDCVTLLFQRPGEAGLECAPNPRQAAAGASWLEVPPQEGAVAVNIGDMLARWSDGRLLSNLHRVRLPTPAECEPPRSRYSIAVFLQADKSVLLTSESHEPITAGDYILSRIRGNYTK
uniref:Fe2OG dioxygenase domain-containing protein n=1 Tax=Pyrodinium bahamense TaxID=73915 RepID=A0A7R9ZWZ2_9DINO